MPVFSYSALDCNRRKVQGTVASDSPRTARATLRVQGLQVLEIVPNGEAAGRARQVYRLPFRRNVRQVVTCLNELSTLLGVGVPLLESLDTLLLQYKGRFGTALLQIRERVREGNSLAAALRQQDQVFDELSVAMVEVGENAGNLDEVLRQYADFQSRFLNFKDRVLSSLLYPAIVFLAATLVSVFLMTVVVPMLLSNLVRSGRAIPWPTRVLKFSSDLLVNYGWVIAIALCLGLVMALVARSTYRGRRLGNRLILAIPVVGEMARKQEISRAALVLSTLLRSGIDLVRALEITRRTSKNLLLQEALAECSKQVQVGRDLGVAAAGNQFFTPVVVQVFSVGQKSGQLEPMLSRLAGDLDQQVEVTAERLSSALEPVLILALSVFVGFILFATLLPILEAGNVIN